VRCGTETHRNTLYTPPFCGCTCGKRNPMDSQPYRLEKYTGIKSRHACPACGKPREFTRYIDANTGEYLADHVGICNRANKCGYHYPPVAYFQNQSLTTQHRHSQHEHSQHRHNQHAITAPNCQPALPTKRLPPVQHPLQQRVAPDYIPLETVEKTLSERHYLHNNLITYLRKRFGNVLTLNACKRFRIGTARQWPGATIFWQIDQQNQVRTGKIMLYDLQTGKRVKQPYNHIDWAHTRVNVCDQRVAQRCEKRNAFNLEQCLFGLHQLSVAQSTTVVIVESEKTALIASIYLPQYTWMACGGLNNLSVKTLATLKQHNVVLYPDLKALAQWEAKATDLRNQGFRIAVSSMLENLPNLTEADRQSGLDLADFLLLSEPIKSPLVRLMEKNEAIQHLVDRLDLVPTIPLNV
jgi:hypothetical protein